LRTTFEYLFGILALNNTDLIPITGTLLLLSTVIYVLVIFSYEINYAQSVNICDMTKNASSLYIIYNCHYHLSNFTVAYQVQRIYSKVCRSFWDLSFIWCIWTVVALVPLLMVCMIFIYKFQLSFVFLQSFLIPFTRVFCIQRSWFYK